MAAERLRERLLLDSSASKVRGCTVVADASARKRSPSIRVLQRIVGVLAYILHDSALTNILDT
jgi:hypothetical protein